MAKTKRSQQMSKSTFIRQHPDLSVEELIAKAQEEGMTITSNLVYKVRGRAKAKAGVTAASTKRGRTVRAAAAREVAAAAEPKASKTKRSKETETMFRKLVLDLGLQRSKALLAEVEEKLDALVAGR